MAPSTFASAAASSSQNHAGARDGASEWARRNGATQTFRRPSGANPLSNMNPPSDGPAAANPSPRYVPPHRNGNLNDTRYSKDQLLDLFKAQAGMDGGLRDGLPNLYVGGWQPDLANGANAAAWGRSDQARDNQPGPDICWDRHGNVEPLGLTDMDEEERELFASTVNTPLKPPTANKDNQQANVPSARKISVSQTGATPGNYGQPSPSVARGSGRRREASESYPFPSNLASPTADRSEQRAPSPPPSLLRRRTDFKESAKADGADVDDKGSTTPFGTLKRNPTGPLSAGLTGPSSPWSNAPQSAGFSPMGSFGNFGLGGQSGTPGPDKRAGMGSGRAESRFKNLLSKDSNEEIGSPTIQRQSSVSNLAKVNEGGSWRAQDPGAATLRETEEDMPSGSAALAAGSDLSLSQQRQAGLGYGTPSRSNTQDEGFGAFGMTADSSAGFGQGFMQGREAFQNTPAAQRVGQMTGNEPMSPTNTNPYQSPAQHGVDQLTAEEGDNTGPDMHNAHLPGLGGFGQDQGQQFGPLGGLGALPNFGRPQGSAGDRSQTSSAGANRGFSGLGGLGPFGNMAGSPWPATQPGFGTPGRQAAGLSNAFGGGIFATSMGEMQSPGLAGLGGSGFASPAHGAPGPFGGSRVASMFPPSMQDQMRGPDDSRDAGLSNFGIPTARNDMQSPFAGQQEPPQGPPTGEQGAQQQEGQPGSDQNAAPGSSASNQPPPQQQRTMVMPDRMRWIYRDPQGQTQGPWSGLEMHDWYKAGFFSPELLVKKYEDPDYEPLAQLIRRIGNSREPFLVPQIGIPHGPPSSQGPTSWAGSAGSVGSAGAAQPPFASSFPSFGTTLTAEQQNALERRKQEEQYLMARQKEHLAQAQIAQRMTGHPQPPHQGTGAGLMAGGQLHRHGSAQSLHSQPSFGSVASPGAFHPSPVQAPAAGGQGNVPGFFDGSVRVPQAGGAGAVGGGVDSLGQIKEEEIPGIMDRLNLGGNRAAPSQFGAPGQPFGQQQQPSQEQQVQQMLQDRARLQQEQAEADKQQQQSAGDDNAPNERLQQFQQLQGQAPGAGVDARFQPAANKAAQAEQPAQAPATSQTASAQSQQQRASKQQEPLSLTEQVEKAVSEQQSPAPQQPGLPQPFPPAPSQSPLPAPAAQRTGRQSVADQLQSESRDRSQTPSVDTPSAAVAPWAKEPSEAPKGPSLKEIQEAEAKSAAEKEAAAAAARRAAFEKEMEAQAAAAAPQPGLPAGASWASAGSPATPASAPSPWAKAAQKPSVAPAKTMAQIQKEEEARKRKVAAAAANAQAQANAMSGVQPPATAKSYANLAGKVSSPSQAPQPPQGSGAWTTVGASGKPKTPAAQPAAPAPRAPSAGASAVPQPAIRKAPSRSSTLNTSGAVNAQDEFKKWAVGELRPDLNKGISPEDVVATLAVLGTDVDMIREAVHGVSNTMDSRHFAEEFLRRKKLADKGQIDTTVPPKSASPAAAAANGAGGWSEVAKKGPQKDAAVKDDTNGQFRVVAKKKGSKR
ncbi:hypothetical protein D0869_06844 [Hortaea werneckii]|uniref:GYF domain-containing protein n=1 Tax=Hortaea werneckii TaxID=91943 RepID=A0A3M6YZG7_HORWE|nr:hypothetical protein D0869_06844 [Hortaea werneckii]RMY08475.1 hypothetical protein D0868_04783 [Hortaea werneckii]